MTIWTEPRDWIAGETVDEDLLNVHLRDNLKYLYENLAIRTTLSHEGSLVTAGAAIVGAILANHPQGAVYYQSPGADADSFTLSAVLGEGTYSLNILGQTRTNAGKVDWTLDGAAIATGQDWYAASNTANVTKTITGIVIATGGRHVLTGTINGKNAASSGYELRLTKLAFKPAAD